MCSGGVVGGSLRLGFIGVVVRAIQTKATATWLTTVIAFALLGSMEAMIGPVQVSPCKPR